MPLTVHSLRSTQWANVTIMSQIPRISQWLFDSEKNCSQILTDLSVAQQLSQQLVSMDGICLKPLVAGLISSRWFLLVQGSIHGAEAGAQGSGSCQDLTSVTVMTRIVQEVHVTCQQVRLVRALHHLPHQITSGMPTNQFAIFFKNWQIYTAQMSQIWRLQCTILLQLHVWVLLTDSQST